MSAGTNTFDYQVFLQEVENAFKNPEIKAIILAVKQGLSDILGDTYVVYAGANKLGRLVQIPAEQAAAK
ncbi:hypothetical protein [Desulfosporosinus shakirovi]|uniref:hypothetical protein n=1 Tax=Desulfosporosinus shakirovi TaxID=2885154 RepID=UPI001E3608EB|nr:hypothetical protein [Desulfosporosinus sp. SRJS8]MCB8814671.1 hypothetical protein [Desulfosporosinus sp. SRJS8]